MTIQHPTAPTMGAEMAGERSGIIRASHKAGRALVMLLCAVFALSAGGRQAHADSAGRNALGLAARAVPLNYAALRLNALKALKLSAPPAANAAPATVTVLAGNANSNINGRNVTAPLIDRTDSRLSFAHTQLTTVLTSFYQGANISLGAGSTTANMWSIRFQTDAPAFEVSTRGNNSAFSVSVDGQPLSRGLATTLLNDGLSRYINVTFNADTQALEVAGLGTVSKVGTGSGYTTGDVLTVQGGTCSTQPQLTVTLATAGAVSNVVTSNKGACTVAPTGPVSVTGGTGTGATFNLIWAQTHTGRTWHKVEVVGTGAFNLRGINVSTYDQVKPWPVSGPRFMWVGDSYTSGTNIDYPGGQPGAIASQALGVEDYWLSGISGSGYINKAGFTNFNDRLTDVTGYAPTNPAIPYVVVTAGGINDTGSSAATVQAAVTSYYSALMSSLPTAYFVCLGPWRAPGNNPSSSIASAVQAGFAASQAIYDPFGLRSVYIDNYNENWQTVGGYATSLTGTGNTDFYTSSDQVHFGQSGWNYLGSVLAGRLQQWFSTLSTPAA